MTDCLVKLYDVAPFIATECSGQTQGLHFRRAMTFEKEQIIHWVASQFGNTWASECSVSFYRQPVSCFIASSDQRLIGFACHEVTQKNFFGPIGIVKEYRGYGVGSGLLIRSMQAMRELGYAYAIVGGAGHAADFYCKTVGALVIENSHPGIYPNTIHTRSAD